MTLNKDTRTVLEKIQNKRVVKLDLKKKIFPLDLIKLKSIGYIYKYAFPYLSVYVASIAIIMGIINKNKLKIKYLMFAHRMQPSKYLEKMVVKNIGLIDEYKDYLVSKSCQEQEVLSRTIILKVPSVIDGAVSKGIILITFTSTFSYYLKNINIKKLAEYYYIVLEPSSAGYCDADILLWKNANSSIIVESTEIRDRDFLNNIDIGLYPVDFGASDWVNYNDFYPMNLNKAYDAVYVANYNPVKRIDLYLFAIKQLMLRGVKIKCALVCARWGDARETIFRLVKKYSLFDILDIYEELNKEEINVILNLSKVNLLLSLKEGSNRSLFEGFFAGTPAILSKNNIGVNKNYINENTGMMVEDGGLQSAILHFRDNWVHYNTREWGMKNISPEKTTEKLINVINAKFDDPNIKLDSVFIKVNQPEVQYMLKNIHKKEINSKVLPLLKEGKFIDNATLSIT